MAFIRSADAAERNAADQMRKLGFTMVAISPTGPDAGIDVRSAEGLAQVKWKGATVGRPDLHRLYGARGEDRSKKLLFFSGSGYSKHAIGYADDVSMCLFVYEQDGRISPVNVHAQKLMASRADAAVEARRPPASSAEIPDKERVSQSSRRTPDTPRPASETSGRSSLRPRGFRATESSPASVRGPHDLLRSRVTVHRRAEFDVAAASMEAQCAELKAGAAAATFLIWAARAVSALFLGSAFWSAFVSDAHLVSRIALSVFLVLCAVVVVRLQSIGIQKRNEIRRKIAQIHATGADSRRLPRNR